MKKLISVTAILLLTSCIMPRKYSQSHTIGVGNKKCSNVPGTKGKYSKPYRKPTLRIKF